MASAVAWRAALGRLGFTPEAQTAIVTTQGIVVNKEVRILTYNKITNLCKVVRPPGGINAAGQPNPGTAVSLRAEDNLKLAAYYLRHKDHASRVVTPCGDLDW